METCGLDEVLVHSAGEVIGDGLIKLPFMAALRPAFPGARITWWASERDTVYAAALSPVVAGMVDRVAGPEAPPAGRFDLILDTQASALRALRLRLRTPALISSAAGFALSNRRPRQWPQAVTGRLQALLEAACGRAQPLEPVRLTDPRAYAAAQALLPEGPAYIGFAPGAGGASKRWPLDSYIQLARTQAARGHTPVFLLGPGDGREAQAVLAALPGALIPERDRRDPFQDVAGPLLVIALAGRLRAAVANDAGPGHMLAAGGAPLLSLQKDHRKAAKFRPAAARLAMLVAEDFGEDMSALPVGDADKALRALLAETATP